MKKIFFAAVVCLFVTIAQAQKGNEKTVNYHLISLEDKNDIPLDYKYYVVDVYDGRQFKENIGTVQKGPFNAKVLARFEKEFDKEVKDYLVKVLPKRDGVMPISLRITDLYVSEFTGSFSETGYASVVVDVIMKEDGRDYVVAAVAARVEGNGVDVTGKHDERIKEALLKCIAKFEVMAMEEFIKLPFDANEFVAGRAAGKAPKGVYVSYVDMLKGVPLSNTNYYLKADGNKYYVVNTTTAKREDNYYAYSDGEVVYLNVSKYAKDAYYAKTDIVGGKYFIENVIYDADNAALMSAMFGLIGKLIFNDDYMLPMLMDGNSGQPFFLSNSEIKTLLSPYPELLKEYKKSDKTNSDIKAVLNKYYALQKQ
ncbi:hypothetical protein [Flavobacterium suzhouense]|uniref:Uncharacterized protein n=1 Tax=Flavobacterium suzhouense TaxID=1529638 RepID=A0ABW5NSJ7_9FLAO